MLVLCVCLLFFSVRFTHSFSPIFMFTVISVQCYNFAPGFRFLSHTFWYAVFSSLFFLSCPAISFYASSLTYQKCLCFQGKGPFIYLSLISTFMALRSFHKRGPEKSSDLPKVTQLVKGGAGMKTQSPFPYHCPSLPLWLTSRYAI